MIPHRDPGPLIYTWEGVVNRIDFRWDIIISLMNDAYFYQLDTLNWALYGPQRFKEGA